MNKHWTLKTFFALDLETTHGNPLDAHVISGTIVKFENGVPIKHQTWLMKPAIQIPDESTEIHGLTNEYVKKHGADAKKSLKSITETVQKILNSGHPLVIFNAAYDLTVLEQQAEYYGLPTLRKTVKSNNWNRIIDSFVLAQGFERFHTAEGHWGKRYTLPEVCSRYGVDFVESHDATADAIGAGSLVVQLMNTSAKLKNMAPSDLFNMQRNWRSRIQKDLRDFFDRKNIEHDGIDGAWPLHSSLMTQTAMVVNN